MGIEIERKFLVKGDGWRAAPAIAYRQGYLHADRSRTVRIRIEGDQATLTIKGASHHGARPEFEYSIPVSEADELLSLCDQPLIHKLRRKIPFASHVWEVDEFLEENAGLVVAEVELASVDEEVALPDWVGEEVTHDTRYQNSQLARRPYSTWDRPSSG